MVGDDGDSGDIPVASMVESIVGCKWSLSLLRLAADGTSRPSALLRACPGLSAKVMNERLQKMQRFGIVRRTVVGDKPRRPTLPWRKRCHSSDDTESDDTREGYEGFFVHKGEISC